MCRRIEELLISLTYTTKQIPRSFSREYLCFVAQVGGIDSHQFSHNLSKSLEWWIRDIMPYLDHSLTQVLNNIGST